MTPEEQKILKIFSDYSAALQTLVPEAVLPYVYTPATFINPDQPPVSVATEEAIRGLFTIVMDGLKAKKFKASQIDKIGVRQLNQETAIVCGTAKRFNQDDQEMGYFGFTYTMSHAKGNWQIILGVIHDTDPVIDLLEENPPFNQRQPFFERFIKQVFG